MLSILQGATLSRTTYARLASTDAPRPYHISALFVVDLVEFRRLAVGDTLRSIYHGMAGDPNSLSNLDQDSGATPLFAVRAASMAECEETFRGVLRRAMSRWADAK